MVKKIFRWVFIFLAGLVVLIGIASGVAWHYKPQITATIHEKIRENINGEFNIDNINLSVIENFPQVAVTLDGIYLRGLRYDTYKKDFLSAKKVIVNVNLFKLFFKEVDVKSIRIINAEVFIFTTKTGYSNLDIFKVHKNVPADSLKGQNPGLLNIHAIYFENVKVAFQDSAKGKSFAFEFMNGKNEIIQTDSSRQFHYKGKIDFERLQFNAAKGAYLIGKPVEADLKGEFIASRHQLNVNLSTLKLPESKIELSGGFHFVPDGKFTLNISSENLNYAEGKTLIPKSLGDKLNLYNIQAPVSLNVTILGKLTPGNDPAVDLHFEMKNALLIIGKERATHVFATGLYTNHIDSTKNFSDPNSKIEITSFKGNIYGFPVQLNVIFKNLLDPMVTLNATVHAEAKDLQREMDSTVIRLSGGLVTADINYTGKLNAILHPMKYGNAGLLKGKTEMKNMTVRWIPRNLTLKNLNNSITFNQDHFSIDKFTFLINQSPMSITGSITGFIPWITRADKKGFVKLLVSSPDLDLTGMMPESKKEVSAKEKDQQMKVISKIVDNIYKRLEFELALNINKLRQHNFTATGITGTVVLKNNQLQANAIKLKMANGNVAVTFGLSDLNKTINPVWVQAVVNSADVKEFFYSFNNFNQHAIDAKNLSGKVNAKITFSAFLDDDFNMMMPSLMGNVDLSVKDGKLTHFAPLEKMSNFLFKDRDFSDVDFAEIKSTFDMKGTELSISRMEVESSVISLFIEGRYSLADSTDLTIQLPLSNLKRRHKDYKPKNVGIETNVGPSVFLRARSDGKGSVAIAYDPFHKFRKK